MGRTGEGNHGEEYIEREQHREKHEGTIQQIFFSGLRPENGGDPKIEKKGSFFGIKNVKNFESGIHIFFLKNFSTHQCGRKGTLH